VKRKIERYRGRQTDNPCDHQITLILLFPSAALHARLLGGSEGERHNAVYRRWADRKTGTGRAGKGPNGT
jgi:hypothetical protein